MVYSKINGLFGVLVVKRDSFTKLGIHSIKDLANFNPDILKKEFGKVGVQLWFHAKWS